VTSEFEDRLAKLFTLAATGSDAEAIAALRAAGRLLNEQGLDWLEVARRIAQPPASPSDPTTDISSEDSEQRDWLKRGILTRANEMLRGQRASKSQRDYLERVLGRIEHRSLRDLKTDHLRIVALEKKLRIKARPWARQTWRR